MAIDREAISEAIFEGTRTPATRSSRPVDRAATARAPATYCVLDVDAANELLDEAGFDRSQPVELWFNSGAGHDAWMEAVGNQLRDNLGVEFALQGNLDFAEYLPLRDAKGMTGPLPDGWSFDYPSAESYLGAAVHAGASRRPVELQLLRQPGVRPTSSREGDQAEQPGGRHRGRTRQAEDLIVEDMPMAPLFFTEIQSVHSENVENVILDLFQRIDAARSPSSADPSIAAPHDPPGAPSHQDSRPRRRACPNTQHDRTRRSSRRTHGRASQPEGDTWAATSRAACC